VNYGFDDVYSVEEAVRKRQTLSCKISLIVFILVRYQHTIKSPFTNSKISSVTPSFFANSRPFWS
jgi:hypothetical protein